MEFIKKLVWFAGTATVAAFLVVWFLELFGPRGPIVALWINWMAITWIAALSRFVRISPPARYYDIKSWERAGRAYERLGVRRFQRLLRHSPFSTLNQTIRLPGDLTISALCHLDGEMRKSEASHLIAFGLILLCTCFAVLRGWFDAAGWMTLFNVLFNAYPVVLQRYNRVRLCRLARRLRASRRS